MHLQTLESCGCLSFYPSSGIRVLVGNANVAAGFDLRIDTWYVCTCRVGCANIIPASSICALQDHEGHGKEFRFIVGFTSRTVSLDTMSLES